MQARLPLNPRGPWPAYLLRCRPFLNVLVLQLCEQLVIPAQGQGHVFRGRYQCIAVRPPGFPPIPACSIHESQGLEKVPIHDGSHGGGGGERRMFP